jgi:hypothetical protein
LSAFATGTASRALLVAALLVAAHNIIAAAMTQLLLKLAFILSPYIDW